MNTRLEKIKEIEKLESRKVNFENLLHDHNDFYTEFTQFQATIKGKIFTDRAKYMNEVITVNRVLFNEYLEKEIKNLEEKIGELIGKL